MEPIVTFGKTKKEFYTTWIISVLFSIGALGLGYLWLHQGGQVFGVLAIISAVIGYVIAIPLRNQRGMPFNTTTTKVSFSVGAKGDPTKMYEIERAAEVKLKELTEKYQTTDISDPRIKNELTEYLRTTFGGQL